MRRRLRAAAAFLRGHPNHVAFWGVVSTFVAVLFALAWSIHGNRVNAAQGLKAHDALCVVRSKIVRDIAKGASKVRRSEEFLDAHPRGIPGIPVKLIRDGINDDRASVESDRGTLAALRVLDCDPAKEEG